MAYAVRADIASEFKRISFTGSNPAVSEAEVDEFIVQAEAIINSAIRDEYALPITDTEAISVLKKITIDFVAYRVDKILKIKDIKATTGDMKQGGGRYQCYMDAQKLLKKIATGELPLGEALRNDAASPLDSYNTSNHYEPCFDITKDQW